MKSYLKATLILFFSIILSCETDTEDLKTNSLVPEENQLLRKDTSVDLSPEEFRSFMQYTAFITAQVLYHDNTNLIRNEFVNTLESNGTGTNAVKTNLSNLIGDHSQAPLFDDAFEDLFYYYQNDQQGSDTLDFTCPKGTHTNVTCTGCNNNDNTDLSYELFKTIVLSENCLELYLPNGYNYSNLNSFHSTAHPLDNSYTNKGYSHPAPCEPDLALEISSINSLNFIAKNNLIVVRPFRDLNISYCTYTDYSEVVNFNSYLFN